MPATLTCRFCRRTGFVRLERVITSAHASRHFYCGACDRTWQIEERQSSPPEPKPKRTRRSK